MMSVFTDDDDSLSPAHYFSMESIDGVNSKHFHRLVIWEIIFLAKIPRLHFPLRYSF